MTVHVDHASPFGHEQPDPTGSAEEPPERRADSGPVDVQVVVEVWRAAGVAPRLGDAALAWLSDHARKAMNHLGVVGELRVRVVLDAEMIAAHEQYLGDASTTDVLTFDLTEGRSAEDGRIDVDVMICLDEAEQRARELGHGVERELLLYVVHGLLHCLGERDDSEAAYASMHAREDAVLGAIGVGATFAPPNARRAP